MKQTIIYIFVILLLANCSKKESTIDYIARVDDKYLKSNDVKLLLNSQKTKEADNHIGKSIITKWVKEEIIYQKAKKDHFDKDLSIQRKVDQYYRSLVVDEYLKFHFQTNTKISNEEIEHYYYQNRDIFRLNNEALKISHIFVEDYNDAKTIKSILESYSTEEKKELYKKYNFETKVIQKGEIVKDLNTELFEKNISEIVGPISSNYGFHVVQILKKYKKNDYIPLSIVRDEIYQTLLQEKNKANYIVFTDSILSNADYEIKEDKLERLLRTK